MFDNVPPQGKDATDYSGLKILAFLAPVLLLFIFLGNADMGLTVCIVLGMIMLAVKVRWNLRKHIWFWAVVVFVLALHVPLFFVVRWPQGNLPTIFYTMPLGIADFLIISKALDLIGKILSKNASSSDQNG